MNCLYLRYLNCRKCKTISHKFFEYIEIFAIWIASNNIRYSITHLSLSDGLYLELALIYKKRLQFSKGLWNNNTHNLFITFFRNNTSKASFVQERLSNLRTISFGDKRFCNLSFLFILYLIFFSIKNLRKKFIFWMIYSDFSPLLRTITIILICFRNMGHWRNIITKHFFIWLFFNLRFI